MDGCFDIQRSIPTHLVQPYLHLFVLRLSLVNSLLKLAAYVNAVIEQTDSIAYLLTTHSLTISLNLKKESPLFILF